MSAEPSNPPLRANLSGTVPSRIGALAGDGIEATVNIRIKEVKTGVQDFLRQHLLSAQQGFAGKIPESQFQKPGRNPQ